MSDDHASCKHLTHATMLRTFRSLRDQTIRHAESCPDGIVLSYNAFPFIGYWATDPPSPLGYVRPDPKWFSLKPTDTDEDLELLAIQLVDEIYRTNSGLTQGLTGEDKE